MKLQLVVGWVKITRWLKKNNGNLYFSSYPVHKQIDEWTNISKKRNSLSELKTDSQSSRKSSLIILIWWEVSPKFIRWWIMILFHQMMNNDSLFVCIFTVTSFELCGLLPPRGHIRALQRDLLNTDLPSSSSAIDVKRALFAFSLT